MKPIFFIIFSIFSLSIFSQSTVSITITDCYKSAEAYYPTKKDKDKISESGNLRLKNIKSEWYPKLSLNGQATYQSEAISVELPTPTGIKKIETSPDQYKATLEISQMIYDGGISSASKEIAKRNTEIEFAQLKTDLQKLKEQVNQVYFGILSIKTSKQLLQVSLNNIKEKAKQVENAAKNGILTPTDSKVIEVERLKYEQQLEEVNIMYLTQIDILNQLTGLKADESTLFEIPNIETPIIDSISRPEQEIFNNQRISIDYNKKLSASQLKPKVYAFATEGYGKPGLNMLSNQLSDFYIVGLSLKWNLWDWQKSSRERQVMTFQKEMISSREELFIRSINIAKSQLKAQINQLEKSIKTDSMIVSLQKDLVKVYSTKLDQGIISSIEYINTVNAELLTSIQAETHKIKLIQARYELKTLLGN